MFPIQPDIRRDRFRFLAGDMIHHRESRHQFRARVSGEDRIAGISNENQQRGPVTFQALKALGVGSQQRVEITAYNRCPAGCDLLRLRERDDLGPCIHSVYFNSSRAVSATRAASTRVMQRWSIGHSRLRHGLHSTSSRTILASGPVGPVVT